MAISRLTLTALFLSTALCAAFPVVAETLPAPVSVKHITQFKSGSDETRFGAFQFLGGLEFTSSEELLGSLSSIRFRPDGSQFVSVLDTGHWLTGRITRDGEGVLAGLADLSISSMVDVRGNIPHYKGDIDAEGLALRDGQALVSFERYHRVDVYPDPGFETQRPLRNLNILIPKRELRSNGGLETVVVAPPQSPLSGTVLTIAENSVDRNGNLLAAILEGPAVGQFRVVRNDPWAVTDGAFLPGGDLLLLERRFSFLGGIGMRIRRIAGQDIRPGALLDGPVQIEADMGYQIDNMEGIDVIAGADGRSHIILVSDDNHSMLQRNLMLEFRLVE